MKLSVYVLFNSCLTLILVISLLGMTTNAVYDPWLDVNDDGYGGIDDIVSTAEHFGAAGDPIAKAYLAYDSGWLDISDKQGQFFNISHNANLNPPYIALAYGKTTLDSTMHRKCFGGFGFAPGWNNTYGGPLQEEA